MTPLEAATIVRDALEALVPALKWTVMPCDWRNADGTHEEHGLVTQDDQAYVHVGIGGSALQVTVGDYIEPLLQRVVSSREDLLAIAAEVAPSAERSRAWFGPEEAVRIVAAGLKERGAAPNYSCGGNPKPHPTERGWKVGTWRLGRGLDTILKISWENGIVGLSIRDFGERRQRWIGAYAASKQELQEQLPAILDAWMWWWPRVRKDDLKPGARFWTLVPFRDIGGGLIPAGALLTFERTDEGVFGEDPERMELWAMGRFDAHCPVRDWFRDEKGILHNIGEGAAAEGTTTPQWSGNLDLFLERAAGEPTRPS